jgi:hypothetical protein
MSDEARVMAEIERLKNVEQLAQKLMTHRDVPCAESALHSPYCSLLNHHHLVCRTTDARDDLYALAAALEKDDE